VFGDDDMIGNIHLKQSFKGLRFKLLMLCLAIFLFQMLFVVLGTSVDIQNSMLKDLDNVPKFTQKMMGEGFMESLMKYGTLTIGYIHPFTMLVFILFIFMTASHMVTTEISSGTIGFTLSKPLSRKRLYMNMAIIIYGGLLCLSLSAYLATFIGVSLFMTKKLSTAPFVSVCANLFLLMIFVTGYIAIFSAISDTGKKLFTYGGVSLFLFYLLSFAAPLWHPLDYIVPISPFNYYKPMAILMGMRISFSTAVSILVVSVAMFVVAGFIFNRRDIAAG